MRTCRAVVLIGLTAVLAVALPSVSAAATMSPVSGPSGGGTVVTISGGSGYNAYTMVNIHFYIPSNLLNMTVIPSYITPDGTSLGFLAHRVSRALRKSRPPIPPHLGNHSISTTTTLTTTR